MTLEQLEILDKADITKTDPGKLAEFGEIDIDTALPGPQRIRCFLQQIENPYCFLSGNTQVKISFGNTEKTLCSALEIYLSSLPDR